MKLDEHGKPADKTYLEKGLPVYLERDLIAYKKGELEHSSLLDCLWGELYGSINSAMWDREISEEQADYLRKTYLFGDEEDEND